MRSILVTGANGFVGRNIVEQLKEDYYVIGIGRQEKSNSGCQEYIKWNIADDDIPSAIQNKDVDYIVHAAACLDKDDFSKKLLLVNCFGTMNVAKLAVEKKVKKVIYISSLPIIGITHECPIEENVSLDPPTMYHVTKAAGEMIVSQIEKQGIPYVSLRVPSPIGPGMPSKTIVPIFVSNALNDINIMLQGKGTRKQNYIDVRDLAEAINKLLEQATESGAYNIGANAISNRELAELCISFLDSKSKILHSNTVDTSDDEDWTTNDCKLKSVIGEYQKHSLKDSIRDIASEMV